MLRAYKCRRCGHVFRPRRIRCPKCREMELEEITLTRGKLISYTVIHATRSGYKPPLTIGLAEFENGAKLLAQLDIEDPEPGMEVVPVNSGTRDGGEPFIRLRRA